MEALATIENAVSRLEAAGYPLPPAIAAITTARKAALDVESARKLATDRLIAAVKSGNAKTAGPARAAFDASWSFDDPDRARRFVDGAAAEAISAALDPGEVYAFLRMKYDALGDKLAQSVAIVDPDAKPESLDPDTDADAFRAWASIPQTAADLDRAADDLQTILIYVLHHAVVRGGDTDPDHERLPLLVQRPDTRAKQVAIIALWNRRTEPRHMGEPAPPAFGRGGRWAALAKAKAVLHAPETPDAFRRWTDLDPEPRPEPDLHFASAGSPLEVAMLATAHAVVNAREAEEAAAAP
ncbi:MAG TPA: hypothetical protein VIK32_15685, partial [Candidatus Limnocylindrales bacterium]